MTANIFISRYLGGNCVLCVVFYFSLFPIITVGDDDKSSLSFASRVSSSPHPTAAPPKKKYEKFFFWFIWKMNSLFNLLLPSALHVISYNI